MKIYKVGGCNRDALMGRECNDIDYSVEAESYEAMKSAISETHQIVYEKETYFTIKAKLKKKVCESHAIKINNNGKKNDDNNNKNKVCDFVLCRKDGSYRDGRHPDCVELGTIWDDLGRRDFTMNSIAVDAETGETLDPYNGRADIENRMIRCTGDTDRRLNEDALRLIRAFRFHITLGFSMDMAILPYFENKEYLEKLGHSVSKERVSQEMDKCFAADTLKSLQALHAFPLFAAYLFTHIISLKVALL